jgi:hypothetical protein
MDADSELVTTLSGKSRVAFDEAVLHIDDLAHGVDDAAKLDENCCRRSLQSARNGRLAGR